MLRSHVGNIVHGMRSSTYIKKFIVMLGYDGVQICELLI